MAHVFRFTGYKSYTILPLDIICIVWYTLAMNIYGTAQAAEYLGIARRTVAYHIYTTGKLSADGKTGHDLYFTRQTLDAFKQARRLEREARRRGRPPKS